MSWSHVINRDYFILHMLARKLLVVFRMVVACFRHDQISHIIHRYWTRYLPVVLLSCYFWVISYMLIRDLSRNLLILFYEFMKLHSPFGKYFSQLVVVSTKRFAVSLYDDICLTVCNLNVKLCGGLVNAANKLSNMVKVILLYCIYPPVQIPMWV